MNKDKECEKCKMETGSVKWRVQWKKFLCFSCHCEYDRPSKRLLEYRILNWKM